MAPDRAFKDELYDVLAERDMTRYRLVQLTREKADWGSNAVVGVIMNGQQYPSLEAMENIGTALDIDPNTWLEYRMAKVRRDINPAKVGWARAAKAARDLGL